MSDTLKKFWSNINNVEGADAINVQADILAYLDKIEKYENALEKIVETESIEEAKKIASDALIR